MRRATNVGMLSLRWFAACGVALGIPVLIAACNVNQSAEEMETAPTTKKKKKAAAPTEVEDPTVTPAEPDDGGVCDLKKSGINFSSATCNTCMQAKCCFETRECVKGDSKCLDLQKCLLACTAGGADGGTTSGSGTGNGAGGGNGMGRDGGGDGGGSGGSCVATCNAQYPAAITKQKAYNDCATTGCLTECGG